MKKLLLIVIAVIIILVAAVSLTNVLHQEKGPLPIPVAVTYPQSGASFKQGEDITIKWSGATTTLPYGLLLRLIDDQGRESPDSPALSKGMGPDLTLWNGTYTFKLSTNIAPGRYRFVIEPAFYKGEPLASVASPYFTVVSSSSPEHM